MTDLSAMRNRGIGTPGVGFSMKRAEVSEEGRKAFLGDVRKVLEEPISIGLPGIYFTATETDEGPRILQTEKPIGRTADIGFGVMGITKPTMGKVLEGMMERRAKILNLPSHIAESELAEVRRIHGETPEGLYEWLKKYKLKPKYPEEEIAGGTYFPKEKRVFQEPTHMTHSPASIHAHEVHGHATQDIVRKTIPEESALGQVQRAMDEGTIRVENTQAQTGLLMKILSTREAAGGGASENLAKLRKLYNELGELNPGEVHANTIELLMTKGKQPYRGSVKHAYETFRQEYASDLKRIREIVDELEGIHAEEGMPFFRQF